MQNLVRNLTIKLLNNCPNKIKFKPQNLLKQRTNKIQLNNTFILPFADYKNISPIESDQINFLQSNNPIKTHCFQKKSYNMAKNQVKSKDISQYMSSSQMTVENTSNEDDYNSKLEDNLKKLNKLRSMPRGTNVESRVAAIKSLLGKREVFKTLQNLRWPQGVICPRCSSKNITVLPPLRDPEDDRTCYDCLNCRKRGEPSGFDDLTGLGEGDVGDIQKWILCWYLLGFCSISQVAKLLGLSIAEIVQLAEMGTQFSEFGYKKDSPKDKGTLFARSTEKRKSAEKTKKDRERKDKMYTESESLGLFKPGPKSRK